MAGTVAEQAVGSATAPRPYPGQDAELPADLGTQVSKFVKDQNKPAKGKNYDQTRFGSKTVGERKQHRPHRPPPPRRG